jgi:predicted nucleotidyltransferase
MDFVQPLQTIVPGARGRILGVLLEIDTELNLRTVARLAKVSKAQASRVLGDLVALGLVTRRELVPASLFKANKDHLVMKPLLEIAHARDVFITCLGEVASSLNLASIVVFGSFVLGKADSESDIDVVIVRADGIDPESNDWVTSFDHLAKFIVDTTGNRVDIIEVSKAECIEKLTTASDLWNDIKKYGISAFGLTLEELLELGHA